MKLLLVFLVIIVCYMYRNNNIETFFPQKQGNPYELIPVAEKGDLLMCKDEWSEKTYNTPYSCHGQSVSHAAFEKYMNSSYSCPNNWLLPGNSIYK